MAESIRKPIPITKSESSSIAVSTSAIIVIFNFSFAHASFLLGAHPTKTEDVIDNIIPNDSNFLLS